MIYATPYKQSTKEATGASVDSGFDSLETVEQLVGGERIHKRVITVGDGEDRIAYSDFKFQ